MTRSSPFTDAVVAAMRKLYPEELADKSFDNTGLLLQAPFNPEAKRNANSVLLTIDLTTAVADEAIKGNHSVVVAYHPIIFRGLKSITLENSQQASLLRLAAKGISVYSPHTAVDVTPGGMADWLCDLVTGRKDDSSSGADSKSQPASSSPKPTQESTESKRNSKDKSETPYHLSYLSYPDSPTYDTSILPHTRSVITPSPSSALTATKHTHPSSTLNNHDDENSTSDSDSNNNKSNDKSKTAQNKPLYTAETTGAGRLITFTHPQRLSSILTRLSQQFHPSSRSLSLAIPQTSTISSLHIKTIALCPGSGSSVLSKCQPQPDMLLTGELSHHEALAVIERGGVVVALNHSNSERGYLAQVMRGVLEEQVREEWERTREEIGERGEGNDEWMREVLEDEGVEVVVSTIDRDPFGTLVFD